jgi:hypothetical protein
MGDSEAREPMRKHAAANEALKLTLDEQGDTAFVVTLVELPTSPRSPSLT